MMGGFSISNRGSFSSNIGGSISLDIVSALQCPAFSPEVVTLLLSQSTASQLPVKTDSSDEWVFVIRSSNLCSDAVVT
ncbi:hypothetical protein D3C87_1160990 [compost metagenome]